MISRIQIVANHRNSRHSTGPKTPAGKERSSLNSFRHGLTGKTVIIPAHEAESYLQHCADLHAALAPVGGVETGIVQELADLRWSLNRLAAYESYLFALQAQTAPPYESGDPIIDAALASANSLNTNIQTLGNLSLYEQRKLRAFHKALNNLQGLQEDRQNRERKLANRASKNCANPSQIIEKNTDYPNGFVFSNDPSDFPEITSNPSLKRPQ